MNALIKSTIREIKNSIGRYLAILVIVALGVGFFAGLRACRPALTDTVGNILKHSVFLITASCPLSAFQKMT